MTNSTSALSGGGGSLRYFDRGVRVARRLLRRRTLPSTRSLYLFWCLSLASGAGSCAPLFGEELPWQSGRLPSAASPAVILGVIQPNEERGSESANGAGARSQGAQPETAEQGGIKDNSFLIEEAYNQEPGVVQHIFNWVRGWDWTDGHSRTFDFVFTQEWPLGSETHQFSYTIPLTSVFSDPDGSMSTDEAGLGDMLLNYRYQLLKETPCCPAIAPRFSVILPTGSESRGLGTGEVGYQFNLPISKEIGCWAYHFNAGFTVTPGVDAELGPGLGRPRHTLNDYNLGASAIWLARKDLNFLVENVILWQEELGDTGSVDHTFQILLAPGVRWAPYTQGDTQWVLGAAVPVGLTRDAPDVSMFFYMSFEHRFKETGP